MSDVAHFTTETIGKGSSSGVSGRMYFYLDVSSSYDETTYYINWSFKMAPQNWHNSLWWEGSQYGVANVSGDAGSGSKEVYNYRAGGSGSETVLCSGSDTHSRSTSAKSKTINISWTNPGPGSGYTYVPRSGSASYNYSVPALDQNYIYYNANGGTGAPGTQTKKIGSNITISNTIPTRDNHTFLYWNTNSAGSGNTYHPGDTYSANSNLSLYAIWQKNSFIVIYDPSGGTGGPTTQTKLRDVNLRLSDEVPHLDRHGFMYWEDGKTLQQYRPGDIYTENADTTMYAVWGELHNYIKVQDNWKYATFWVKVNGHWVQDEFVYIKVNGRWRK